MKKHLLILTLLAFIGINASAQDISSSDFHIGIGLNPTYEISDIDFFDDDVIELDNKIPYIVLSWDRLMAEDIGPGRITAGGFFAYSQYVFGEDDLIDPINFHFWNLGVRGSYVLNPLLGGKIEPYAGLQIIYNYVLLTSSDGDSFLPLSDNEGQLNLSIYAGSRFMLTKGLGVFLELDPLFITAKAGLVIKRH